jgi:hypothetical protein
MGSGKRGLIRLLKLEPDMGSEKNRKGEGKNRK